jgi:catalase (peroxidase I)
MRFSDPSGKAMMLPSDIVLIEDPEFRTYVSLYAKDQAAFYRSYLPTTALQHS